MQKNWYSTNFYLRPLFIGESFFVVIVHFRIEIELNWIAIEKEKENLSANEIPRIP